MHFTFDFEPIQKNDVISVLLRANRQRQSIRNSSYVLSNLPHIYIARHLILTNSEILVTPSMDPSCTNLTVIGKASYMKGSEMMNRIHRLELSVLASGTCCQADLEKGIKFTMQTRLSCNWGQCGEFLLQGFQFLKPSCNAALLGIKSTFCATDSCLKMILVPEKSMMSQFSLKDLGVPSEMIADFENHLDGCISDIYLGNRWVHVLPTMKKGEVVEIRKTLPLDSPFNSYEDLRIYWRSLYGYQLPESKADVLYVQIVFRLISDEPLTYPSCCVRSGGLRPAVLAPEEAAAAARDFVSDTLRLSRRLLCGAELRLADSTAGAHADTGAAVASAERVALAVAAAAAPDGRPAWPGQVQSARLLAAPSAALAGTKRLAAADDGTDEQDEPPVARQKRLRLREPMGYGGAHEQ